MARYKGAKPAAVLSHWRAAVAYGEQYPVGATEKANLVAYAEIRQGFWGTPKPGEKKRGPTCKNCDVPTDCRKIGYCIGSAI